MTDEQAVRILSERMGWSIETRKCYAGVENVTGWGKNRHLSLGHPEREFTLLPPDEALLTSKDALAPVLEGLSDAEWADLAERVVPVGPMKGVARRILALPPRDLALAIAEAIQPDPAP